MTVNGMLKWVLIAGLFFISLGGVLIHYHVHPPGEKFFGAMPFYVGIASTVLVPLLFCFRSTVHYGYLLNGFTCLVGAVTMGHFSLVVAPIWADIFVLFGKFALGFTLFHLLLYPAGAKGPSGVKWFRYPHLGFWAAHLVSLSFVYAVGNTFLR